MKKKIVLVGAYGCGNKGDDAILEGILYSLSDVYNFTVVAGNYGGIEKKFGTKVIKCRMNEGLTLSVLRNLMVFFPQYLLECMKCDCVLIGGGSLLHDLTKYNLLFFALLQRIAQIFRKKVIYINVGAGPITTKLGKRICKNVIGKAEKVFVRDIPDYKLLRDIGMKNVELTADMAFNIEADRTKAEILLSKYGLQRKEYIVVTACEWFQSDNFWKKEKMDFSEEKLKLGAILKQIMQNTKLPMVFLPTVFHDYKLGKELQKIIQSDTFYVLSDEFDCTQMSALVAESKLLVGTRMHSIIFAIRAGVPCLVNIYDGKVRSLLKRCDMMEYTFTLDDTYAEKKVEKILSDESEISNHLANVTDELRKMARKPIIYLREK